MTNVNNNVISINIEADVPKIPIKIGNLNYEFSLSDDNISTFRKRHKEVLASLEELAAKGDDGDVMELAKEALGKGYDAILGDGAFEGIYAQTPSVIFQMEYFAKLVEGINNVLADKGFTGRKPNRYERRSKKK